MNICSSSHAINTTPFRPVHRSEASAVPGEESPRESFTFSGESSTTKHVLNGVRFAGLGAVPGVGAVANFAGVWGSEEVSDVKAVIASMGLTSNLVGSVTLVTGLITGNQTASKVGIGLLAGSAATAGYAYCAAIS